jgi:hypothetical protein
MTSPISRLRHSRGEYGDVGTAAGPSEEISAGTSTVTCFNDLSTPGSTVT